MANLTSNLKSWGAVGSEYPDGYSYTEGEQPVDSWDNFFVDNTVKEVHALQAVVNDRLETDKGASGSEPTSPETGHLFWNTTDDRLEARDASQSAWRPLMYADGDTMQGVLDMGGYQITDGTGPLNLGGDVSVSGTLKMGGATVATQSWATGGNISVGDLAGVTGEGSGGGFDADTVDGEHASAFANAGHTHALGDLSNVTATGEGAGGGFDADTVDGQHADDITAHTHIYDELIETTGTSTYKTFNLDSEILVVAELTTKETDLGGPFPNGTTILEFEYNDGTTESVATYASNNTTTERFVPADFDGFLQGKTINTVRLKYDNQDNGGRVDFNRWELTTIGKF